MNKIAGSILILAAAISGHGVFVFLATHPQIHKYDVPGNVANMILVAVATSVTLGAWGIKQMMSQEPHR
jgi:hypothetical protein